MGIMKNIFAGLKEAFRDKSSDIKNAQSYRDDNGDIVKNFGDQEHINMVDSTAIDNVKYNKKTGEATITFRNSDKGYVFPDVPQDVIDGMKGQPSKGRYYHNHIKQYSVNNK